MMSIAHEFMYPIETACSVCTLGVGVSLGVGSGVSLGVGVRISVAVGVGVGSWLVSRVGVGEGEMTALDDGPGERVGVSLVLGLGSGIVVTLIEGTGGLGSGVTLGAFRRQSMSTGPKIGIVCSIIDCFTKPKSADPCPSTFPFTRNVVQSRLGILREI